mgnify:CR=1 FL=1
MGFLDALISIADIISPAKTSPTDTKTIAQLHQDTIKHESDRAAEMEYYMEIEKDPIIRKKLEWRLNSGIYEWEDLVNKS